MTTRATHLMTPAMTFWSKWAILVIALGLPLGVQSLGLGEARVESFLNQPLEVRMRLLNVSEDELDSLTVMSASPDDYQRLGLMNDALALGLELSLDRSVSPPIVRVSSARPVSDPVVQLLVDARWASGRMLREYTLFLDPPTIAVEAPAPSAPPATAMESDVALQSGQSPSRPDRTPARVTQQVADRESGVQGNIPVATSAGESYGPVSDGETLWSIASASLPAGDVTINQMMVAMVELNPGAFRDRNINQLLRGTRLQLPDAAQVRAIDAAVAAAEVAAQNRAFGQSPNSGVPTVSSDGREPAAVDAPATADAAALSDSGAAVDHRLSLVPPGDVETGSGVSEDASEVADLRQRLARAEEELYAARQEAEEFQSQVDELETLVRANPQGVGVRDAELAGLEATLRAAREATRADADPQTRSEVSNRLDAYLEQFEAASQGLDAGARRNDLSDEQGAETPVDTADDAATEAVEASPASDSGDAAGPAEPEPAAEAPERAVTEIESSRGFWLNPILLLVVGLVVVLLIGVFVTRALLRRRQAAESTLPLTRAVDLPRAETRDQNPVDSARAQLKDNPANLSLHLALLKSLAAEGREEEFGDALESMFEQVESEAAPEWRAAIALADSVVPGHPLVKGSSDWVSDQDASASDELSSDPQQESEVDDLMSRLDSDLDNSDFEDSDPGDTDPGDSDFEDTDPGNSDSEDSDLKDSDLEDSDLPSSDPGDSSHREWLGQDDLERTVDREAPVLSRNDDVDVAEPENQPSAADDDEGDEDVEFDLGAWRDEEAPSSVSRDGGDESMESAESDALALDWPGEEERSTPEGGIEQGQDPSGDENPGWGSADEAEDDIFAQGDDDIDVKLDLAKAYMSWNSNDSARTLLQEVVREGNQDQQQAARTLLADLADDSDS